MSASSGFRRHLYRADHPRIADLVGVDAYAYREVARNGDFTGQLIEGWTPLYLNDFVGVTEDGRLRAGLFPLSPARMDEKAPAGEMVAAAETLLGLLDKETEERLRFPVDAVEWQTWANPEFMQFDTGLRLDYQPTEVREAALALVRASLSEEGYELTRRMMLINGFLGDVVGLPLILNDFSYNIALYGSPDEHAPWGWQLYGHHVALNCLVVDGRMSLSPVFLGAEPDQIDEGQYASEGSPFGTRITPANELMALLPEDLRRAAVVYEQMVDPAMPEDRVHPGDERHLAGAFQDNRVIPFEGLRVSDMPTEAQRLVLKLIEQFCVLLPAGPRAARMREVEAHLDETWFSWIGGYHVGDVFYYRIQSPVLIAELDHHCGVFLDYDEAQPFHIHTVLRTPHGNDYGRAWVRQWQAAQR